jgi:protein SCO1/2
VHHLTHGSCPVAAGRRPRFAGAARAIVVLAAVLVACTGCGGGGAGGGGGGGGANGGFAGIVREPAPDVSTVALPAADGAHASTPFRAQDHGVLIAYFGYLSCPDVCPTTMADLRTAIDGLAPADQAKVDVVMTTIDPARDTAEALTAYVHGFIARGRGLRTDDQTALRTATEAFGADYQVGTNASGAVEVAHTSYVYVIDSTGHVRLTWPFGTTSTDMRRDLQRLLRLTADET